MPSNRVGLCPLAAPFRNLEDWTCGSDCDSRCSLAEQRNPAGRKASAGVELRMRRDRAELRSSGHRVRTAAIRCDCVS
jgi:hypothetical protein